MRPNTNSFLLFLLTLVTATSLGCQSLSLWWNPTSGYEAVGTPELDFDAARALCEEQSEFEGFSGSSQVDWTAFEHCMKPHGWVRPAQR